MAISKIKILDTNPKLRVAGQRIEIVNPAAFVFVSGSEGQNTLKFEFSPDWINYTKTVIFAKRFTTETKAVLLESDSIEVPPEMLADQGELMIGVYGVYGGLKKPTIWSGPFKIEEGCQEGGSIPAPSTDAYTQIIAEFNRLLNLSASASVDAEDAAVTVERTIVDDHYNFYFNFEGLKGEPGDIADGIEIEVDTQNLDLSVAGFIRSGGTLSMSDTWEEYTARLIAGNLYIKPIHIINTHGDFYLNATQCDENHIVASSALLERVSSTTWTRTERSLEVYHSTEYGTTNCWLVQHKETITV